MSESFNIYLDESCHLEHDHCPVMVLGAVWCLADKYREVTDRIGEIRAALVDYFLDDDDLNFRGIIIGDKSALKHEAQDQTHDDWYYKMCFQLLEVIIEPTECYSIYMDMKDTRGEQKRANLEGILRNANLDGDGQVIRRVQQIRSHESSLMQLTDLLVGAVTYANRGLTGNEGKMALVRRLREQTQLSLLRSTWLRARKVNLSLWKPRKDTRND
jgi:hypothetical protein